jgi:hypothetical protein
VTNRNIEAREREKVKGFACLREDNLVGLSARVNGRC